MSQLLVLGKRFAPIRGKTPDSWRCFSAKGRKFVGLKMKKAPVFRGLIHGELYQIKKREPTATMWYLDNSKIKLYQIKKREPTATVHRNVKLFPRLYQIKKREPTATN